MSDHLLDLLDAITEVRVGNPELRQSVLAALRLAIGEGHLGAARLHSLRNDGSTEAIIAQGDASQNEEADRALILQARELREPFTAGPIRVHPLGKERRLYGVLLVERGEERICALLADLFLQWSAVAEFVDLAKAELVDENFALREEIRMQFADHNLVGNSGAFRHVLESARRVAASTATVLIQGETGTGKELIANLIHQNSPRANAAFITVNCGALAESLLETELFGHVKGAFTGAVADRKGRFEAANGGTIFLDEIGEISEAMQVRLLRVLQEMEIVRVGDHKTRKLDVRVIVATNRDLEVEVAEGRFRSDLYYRLNVVHLAVPPLRQRPEDIPLLVEHFLSIYCQRNCKYVEAISREALEIMMEYPWPGNIRELENCIEKMVVMTPRAKLDTDLLPMALMAYHQDGEPPPENGSATSATPPASFEEQLAAFTRERTAEHVAAESGELYDEIRAKWERHLFEAILDACDNNKSRAARILGITRNTLNSRLTDLCEVRREWKVE